jgi:hypothetical protein
MVPLGSWSETLTALCQGATCWQPAIPKLLAPAVVSAPPAVHNTGLGGIESWTQFWRSKAWSDVTAVANLLTKQNLAVEVRCCCVGCIKQGVLRAGWMLSFASDAFLSSCCSEQVNTRRDLW